MEKYAFYIECGGKMTKIGWLLLLVFFCNACADRTVAVTGKIAQPLAAGKYSVGSTNMEIAAQFADIGDDAMHDYLLGKNQDASAASENRRFVASILKHPESAWVTDVSIPDERDLYGPASGLTMPVVTFIAFPTPPGEQKNRYAFPYHDAQYGEFEDMLRAGEAPRFADPDARYPLILLAHGASAHGLYDVRHAHSLASHGFIVAVINYGDDRTALPQSLNPHLSYLRPLLTRAVLDSILESSEFGAHIDTENIGITGHSFGGFTALAVAGGPFEGNDATVTDPRITAAAIAAPWVGGHYNSKDMFAFGDNNRELSRVTIPVIVFFGTRDEVTLASFILPAARKLSGPTYVVELVDQPHVFEGPSWQDRDNWELAFFLAYLKNDADALATLKTARSMSGGNSNTQLFDYQRLPGQN